jgi:hypothetical protein
MRNPRQPCCAAAIAAARRIEPLGRKQESGFSGLRKTASEAASRRSRLALA